jgi:tryptophan synthase beta chain
VLEAVKTLAETEGILSALESAHGLVEAIRLAPSLATDKTIVVNLSGRGEKDLFIFGRHLSSNSFREFIERYAEELKEGGN